MRDYFTCNKKRTRSTSSFRQSLVALSIDAPCPADARQHRAADCFGRHAELSGQTPGDVYVLVED